MAKNHCADCGTTIGEDAGPPDGWQLEDGRTVCHACCVADFKQLVAEVLRDQTL
jgi:recombinational DNA repair protein (RecF pathway)